MLPKIPQNNEVLHHFLAQVVIDPVDLFFRKQFGEVTRKLVWRLEVTTEGLLDDDSCPAVPNDNNNNYATISTERQTHQ